jgi:hypothetical protein
LRNTSETLARSTNGAFTFVNKVVSGQPYSVTVETQPVGQNCTVANGSGTVGGANVTNVAVSCVVLSYSIGGTVAGLTGGTLQLSLTHLGAAKTINVTSDGPYTFDPEKVPYGDSYVVSVASPPAGQECSVTNGTGIATAPVTNVGVECTLAQYTVGGTITGLTGAGLQIENGAANVSPAPGATDFTLLVELDDGTAYDVGIAHQPAGQTCVITHSQGHVNAKDITDVAVNCLDNPTHSLVGTYVIPNLLPDHLVYLTLFADGVYVSGSIENDPSCGNQDGNGVEYGVYGYDPASLSFTIKSAVVDTNGVCGVWNNGSLYDGSLAVVGTGQDSFLTLTLTNGSGQLVLVPVVSSAGEIFGSFADRYHRNFWLFADADGGGGVYFLNTETQADATSGHDAGVEYACGTITGKAAGTLDPDFNHGHCNPPAPHHDGAVDTNGTSGLSDLTAPWSFNVLIDTLSSSTFDGTRITPN